MNNQFDIDYTSISSITDLLQVLRQNEVPKNVYWRYIEAYQERKARERGIPLYGQFELTPLCNLDCKMCYVHLDQKQMNGRKILPAEWWKNIMYCAHSLGMTHASLTGGECLTYPKFDDIYLYLRQLGIKPSVKTNGILLDRERIEFFKHNPPRGITISLYGSCNEAYQKVTGHAVFDTVYNNLMNLKNTEIPVDIAITPSIYMYDDLDRILEVVKKIGFPYSLNIMLFPPREETGRELCDISINDYIEIYKKLQAHKSMHAAKKEETEAIESIEQGESRVGIRCGAGRSSFNITWNGTMTACENLNSNRISLDEYSFSDAWRLINEDALSYPLPIECFGCEYNAICFNCMAYRCSGMNKGHCNPKICERTKLLVKEGIYSL